MVISTSPTTPSFSHRRNRLRRRLGDSLLSRSRLGVIFAFVDSMVDKFGVTSIALLHLDARVALVRSGSILHRWGVFAPCHLRGALAIPCRS
jgi:hypothetical protein